MARHEYMTESAAGKRRDMCKSTGMHRSSPEQIMTSYSRRNECVRIREKGLHVAPPRVNSHHVSQGIAVPSLRFKAATKSAERGNNSAVRDLEPKVAPA